MVSSTNLFVTLHFHLRNMSEQERTGCNKQTKRKKKKHISGDWLNCKSLFLNAAESKIRTLASIGSSRVCLLGSACRGDSLPSTPSNGLRDNFSCRLLRTLKRVIVSSCSAGEIKFIRMCRVGSAASLSPQYPPSYPAVFPFFFFLGFPASSVKHKAEPQVRS